MVTKRIANRMRYKLDIVRTSTRSINAIDCLPLAVPRVNHLVEFIYIPRKGTIIIIIQQHKVCYKLRKGALRSLSTQTLDLFRDPIARPPYHS